MVCVDFPADLQLAAVMQEQVLVILNRRRQL